MCSRHNARLGKSVTTKKMSVIDNKGRLTWTTRETVILVCPYKPEFKLWKTSSQLTAPNSESDGAKGISNKIVTGLGDDQPQRITKKFRVEEDI